MRHNRHKSPVNLILPSLPSAPTGPFWGFALSTERFRIMSDADGLQPKEASMISSDERKRIMKMVLLILLSFAAMC